MCHISLNNNNNNSVSLYRKPKLIYKRKENKQTLAMPQFFHSICNFFLSSL